MFTQNITATKNALNFLEIKNPKVKAPLQQVDLKELVQQACERVAPIWPLANFIAVNPLQGFEGGSFQEAVEIAKKLYHAKGVPDLSFFHEQFRKGRISTGDLVETLKKSNPSVSVDELVTVLVDEARQEGSPREQQPLQDVFLLLSEWADQLKGTKLYSAMQAEITKWCSAYFDRGEAAWSMPGREEGFYVAWKKLVTYDQSFEQSGVAGFRDYVKKLPSNSLDAIKKMVQDLGIPSEVQKDYLSRHFASSPGWAGLMAHIGSEAQFHLGQEKFQPLMDFLAVRLAYDTAGAIQVLGEPWVNLSPWQGVVNLAHEKLKSVEPLSSASKTLGAGLIWLEAFEKNYRENLLKRLGSVAGAQNIRELGEDKRPKAQAVFCIDVRSEAFRRNLETQGHYDTYGFAGFFAVPLAHQGFGDSEASPQCPVLIRPKYLVKESPIESQKEDTKGYLSNKHTEEALETAIHEVKNTSVSPFAMVETFGGIGFFSMYFKSWVPSLVKKISKKLNSLGTQLKTEPVLEGEEVLAAGPYQAGIPVTDQIAIAENSLRIMGLTQNFARLVLLCGHGSTTTNNAYASALDCGACGGHRGAPNARVAAKIFNDQRVRNALQVRGISIPLDTVFLAGEHNTATDTITVFDEEKIPTSHLGDVASLKLALNNSKASLNLERTQRFDNPAKDEKEATLEVARRSLDWSEARPEWGLAGNAAFIVAKRNLTKRVNLESRSFLHSYDWKSDPNGTALEVIMTAPMVVAEWINTQYYFSTVDNEVFGSGTKVIHNVVGKLGVMQGNVSDLKIGLPLQSVSNGKEFVHEPMRLLVVIEAPKERIAAIVEKHASVKKLVKNEWIRLVALDPTSQKFYRYSPLSEWELEIH